jgi:hypothetical protein
MDQPPHSREAQSLDRMVTAVALAATLAIILLSPLA